MATWREVENYLSSNYQIEKIDHNVVSINFGLNDGRSQLTFISGHLLDDAEDAFVSFSSPFARVDQISPQQLANCMADTQTGSFARFGDWYVLRHNAPLGNLDANEIEWPLKWVTVMADLTERSLGLGDNF